MKRELIAYRLISILLIFSLSFLLVGCKDDESSGSGEMKDPYEAYGLDRETSFEKGDWLQSAMSEKPPKAILLEAVYYDRAYYEPVSQGGEILLEKGKSATHSLDLEIVHESGATANIKSTIDITYIGKKDEELFSVDTHSYGNPTLVINGLYVTEYGEHVVLDKGVHYEYVNEKGGIKYEFFGETGELISIPLRVDLGEATKGDGNIGFVYFRIKGVKR